MTTELTIEVNAAAWKADGDGNRQSWTSPAFGFDPRPASDKASAKDRIGTTAQQPGR